MKISPLAALLLAGLVDHASSCDGSFSVVTCFKGPDCAGDEFDVHMDDPANMNVQECLTDNGFGMSDLPGAGTGVGGGGGSCHCVEPDGSIECAT